MTTKRAAFGAAGLFLLATLAGAGCGKKQDAQRKPGIGDPGGSIPVQVAPVQTGTIAASVPVTGNIQALQDVQLSPRAAGRVIAVNFREGQVVRAGQIVVQQDTTDLQANVNQAKANILQAQANVSSNQAKVSQAQTNYILQVQTARQAVAQAKAQVASARQNYLKIKGGSRPQQILQGKSQVILAKANLDNAQTILTRNQSLFAQGAIAKADLDTAQTNYAVQQQTYQNARQALSLTQAGAQTEDIAAALAQLQQQQANLSTAVANQQQVQVRQQDVVAARDAVRQAQAAVQVQEQTLAFNQQQVANAFIRSPINGIVAAREVEPGQVASPGTNLMRIVGLGSVYYEPTISETDFASMGVGNAVTVQVDALPGRSFAGNVSAVYPPPAPPTASSRCASQSQTRPARSGPACSRAARSSRASPAMSPSCRRPPWCRWPPSRASRPTTVRTPRSPPGPRLRRSRSSWSARTIRPNPASSRSESRPRSRRRSRVACWPARVSSSSDSRA